MTVAMIAELVQRTDEEWKSRARCAVKRSYALARLFDASTLEDGYRATNVCHDCPVRRECLRSALENGDVWSVWGGRTPHDLRRVLSINTGGAYYEWKRALPCPYCRANTSSLTTNDADVVTCSTCSFSWQSSTSARRVRSYFAKKTAKKSRADKTSPRKRKVAALSPAS